jgi:hypothetical protein
MCGMPQAFSKNLRLATIIYSGGNNVIFSKIPAFKGTIRNLLSCLVSNNISEHYN